MNGFMLGFMCGFAFDRYKGDLFKTATDLMPLSRQVKVARATIKLYRSLRR